jgi:transglutaminase-like putative cysteine protease
MDDEIPPVTLIDHRTVEWSKVRQTRYWMYQRFQYQYPGSIRELRQRLVVIPTDRYGDQRLCGYDLDVSVPDATVSTAHDSFGNRVFHVYAPRVESELVFEMRFVVERDLDETQAPRMAAEEVALYREATPLTAPDAALTAAARRLAEEHPEGEPLAAAINSWVYGAMRYRAGVTHVGTTAAEALAGGEGLCQDYAHIMLAICRAAGLPARYISGHMLGEGGSHAWVETLLPHEDGYRAVAFDPTNHRRITPAYITVAIGRDYGDVSPTSGSYIAPYTGRLLTSKRAGLTHLEYWQPSGTSAS